MSFVYYLVWAALLIPIKKNNKIKYSKYAKYNKYKELCYITSFFFSPLIV